MNLTLQNTKLIGNDFTRVRMMHDTNVSNATVMKFVTLSPSLFLHL